MESVALLAAGFLAAGSDLEDDFVGSGLADLDWLVEGRVGVDAAGFLGAGAVGLVASFLTAVVVFDACDDEVLPTDWVEGVLEAAGLGVAEVVLGVAGFAVALLAVPVAGRPDAEAG